MSGSKKSDNWLLVQWGNGDRGIVNLKSVITPPHEANVGTVVVADKSNGNHEAATILNSSRDRQLLERQIKTEPKVDAAEEDTAEQTNQDEQRDFSPSASSWEPSDDNASSDEGEVKPKKTKIECFSQRSTLKRRTSKILKPSHRADAINSILAKARKRTFDETKAKEKNTMAKYGADRKSLPDSTRKNNSPAPNSKSDIISINISDILDMKQCFLDLFRLLKELKTSVLNDQSNDNAENQSEQPHVKCEMNNTMKENNMDIESEVSDRSRSEELNRSDDNVLITNKYNNANNDNNILVETNANLNEHQTEWIPIGTGQTLIHKDQYRKVNWKSYTIATRTLLLAVFPRRILATHSLTGKRSPAFQDKPAKMCLDPKIVSDVIIEITDRFNVKENLVRSIITTKCADECKMYKTRLKRKTLPGVLGIKTLVEENDDYDIDEANQTY